MASLQFGPWGGAGMAAGDGRLARQLAAAGAPPLPPAAGLSALAAALDAVHGGLPVDQVGSCAESEACLSFRAPASGFAVPRLRLRIMA